MKAVLDGEHCRLHDGPDAAGQIASPARIANE
jgi:hypothetical protein